MKQMLISIAKNLVQAAADRAENRMRKQAELRVVQVENYTANAGGWT